VDNRLGVGAVMHDAAMTSPRTPNGSALPPGSSSGRWSPRLPLLLAVVALVAGGGVVLGRGLVLDRPQVGTASSAASVHSPDDERLAAALAALRRWDTLRATAYAAGDPARLRSLYVEGSSAATADVGILRSYAARDLVVDGMRTQVLSVQPVELHEQEVTLRVRDRLVGAEVVDPEGRRLALPRDQATTRLLTLVRSGEGWRMREVRQE
jgi:hypothetical protein